MKFPSLAVEIHTVFTTHRPTHSQTDTSKNRMPPTPKVFDDTGVIKATEFSSYDILCVTQQHVVHYFLCR